MDKPSYRLVGAPCGQHGQYTFYKAIRFCGAREKIVAIGDFFFVRIWQDSELVSIGELQLLWTDRVSDQTLVSLRLYFLPENTPDGRGLHGEDEVLAINDKVVLRADDLLSWVSNGRAWKWGLPAVWRGACAPPADSRGPAHAPLHCAKLDFTDIDREKSIIDEDSDCPGVVVFSYPRYCRYRALVRRLEGIQADWLRDSLVAALGGYAAPTKHTRILYCKDTFEYPELEGHEFVCNHLAPRLKGRPRGRRKRRARSQSHSSDRTSDSDSGQSTPLEAQTPTKQTLRPTLEKHSGDERDDDRAKRETESDVEDRAFIRQLKSFYKDRNQTLKLGHSLKDLSLRNLYKHVTSRGGYDTVCREEAWGSVLHSCKSRTARTRKHHLYISMYYERILLPYESHERMNGAATAASKLHNGTRKVKKDIKIHPQREYLKDARRSIDKRLSTPSPKQEAYDPSNLLSHTTAVHKDVKDDLLVTSKPAAELNQEFLDSLPKTDTADNKPLKITVKPVEKLLESPKAVGQNLNDYLRGQAETGAVSREDLEAFVRNVNMQDKEVFSDLAAKFNFENADTKLLENIARAQQELVGASALSSLSSLGDKYMTGLANGQNGGVRPHTADMKGASRPSLGAARSSLRSVRVKPPGSRDNRPYSATQPGSLPSLRADSSSTSPVTITNCGVNYPPPTTAVATQDTQSDDEIVEVPYKPKTPEIIDLDEYPESPQSVKKKKLDILKERGLEVTAIPNTWPTQPPLPNIASTILNQSPMLLNPAMQHQIMTQAQLFQMYNMLPQSYSNGAIPPKVIQAKSIFGNTGPEKTVYGNPKDPFMAPPHILKGTPIKPARNASQETRSQSVLDLTAKPQTPSASKPAVEIVRIPNVPSPSPKPQNLAKNYTLLDGKAVVGSNLEITLVSPKPSPNKSKAPQKRSSNGKFAPTKQTPPKEPYKNYPSPIQHVSSTSRPERKSNIIVPNYQINSLRDEASPTSSTSSKDSSNQSNQFKSPSLGLSDLQKVPMSNLTPFMDPMYVNALYSSLAGQLDQRQMAVYREFMAGQLRGYSGLLNMSISNTPTTKN